MRLRALEAKRTATDEVLDRLPFGVVLLDARGHVVHANREAERLGRERYGLRLSPQGLGVSRPGENGRLRQLIGGAAATARGGGLSPGGEMSLSRPSGRRPLAVLVAPLAHALLVDGFPAVVVFVSDPEKGYETPQARLQRLYGLTGREAALAARRGVLLGKVTAARC